MATPVIFDALLEVQASTTDTASDASAALEFPLSTSHDDNDEHDQVIHVVFDATAVDLSGGAVVDFQVGVDTASGFPSEVIVGEIAAIQTTGRYRIALDLATVELLEAGATHLRAKVVMAGGTPSITWNAFIVKP